MLADAQQRQAPDMKKLYAYYEHHASRGYVVECYVEGEWVCSFTHDVNDKDSLYQECERRAKLNGARMEALIRGLPQSPQPKRAERSAPVSQACFA
jgi:hypothetical protein